MSHPYDDYAFPEIGFSSEPSYSTGRAKNVIVFVILVAGCIFVVRTFGSRSYQNNTAVLVEVVAPRGPSPLSFLQPEITAAAREATIESLRKRVVEYGHPEGRLEHQRWELLYRTESENASYERWRIVAYFSEYSSAHVFRPLTWDVFVYDGNVYDAESGQNVVRDYRLLIADPQTPPYSATIRDGARDAEFTRLLRSLSTGPVVDQ